MKKFNTVSRIGLVLIAICALVHLSAATVMADPAIVINKDGLCILPGVDEDGKIEDTLSSFGEVVIIMENDNKYTKICKGEDGRNLSGQAQHIKGEECEVELDNGQLVTTTDTDYTISANGIIVFKCTYTKP
jgi:hypothetical protein